MANKNPNETVTEESRYNIFQDAIQQSCHKIVHNILRFLYIIPLSVYHQE